MSTVRVGTGGVMITHRRVLKPPPYETIMSDDSVDDNRFDESSPM